MLAAAGALLQPHIAGLEQSPDWMFDWTASATVLPEAISVEFDQRLALDPLGTVTKLYEALVPPPNRRQLGTFFTPQAEAREMLAMWTSVHEPPAHVVDVGAGVGMFSTEMLMTWPRADGTAIDVNPVLPGEVHDRSGQRVLDGVQRVERGIEVLKDHLHVGVQLAKLPALVVFGAKRATGTLLQQLRRK